MNKTSHRVFFAIELSSKTKMDLLAFQDRLFGLQGIPIKPENFHITLSFLGETLESKIDALLDCFKQPLSEPFEISTDQLRYYSKAKILALNINHGSEQLTRLKSRIEKTIQRQSHFDLDKQNYQPHISLFRKIESLPNNLPSFEQRFKVNSFCLFVSSQTKNSVRYDVIEEWRLRKKQTTKQILLEG